MELYLTEDQIKSLPSWKEWKDSGFFRGINVKYYKSTNVYKFSTGFNRSIEIKMEPATLILADNADYVRLATWNLDLSTVEKWDKAILFGFLLCLLEDAFGRIVLSNRDKTKQQKFFDVIDFFSVEEKEKMNSLCLSWINNWMKWYSTGMLRMSEIDGLRTKCKMYNKLSKIAGFNSEIPKIIKAFSESELEKTALRYILLLWKELGVVAPKTLKLNQY